MRLFIGCAKRSMSCSSLSSKLKMCQISPLIDGRIAGLSFTHTVHYVAKSSDSTLVIARNSQFFIRDGCQEHTLICTASVPRASPSNTQCEEKVLVPSPIEEFHVPTLWNPTNPISSIAVQYGLSPELSAKFRISSPFTLPPHKAPLTAAILDCHVRFKGKGIISPTDLASLQ